MNHARMPPVLVLLAAVAVSTGCVQRTITIESEPSGALVYLNDTEVGRTPVTVPFTFYGVYDVRLELAGYQTLTTAEEPDGPWWENPGPDLIAEAIPDNNVEIKWFYAMQELQPVDPVGLVDRAKYLRQSLDAPAGEPLPPFLPPADAAPTPAPQPEPAPAEEPTK